MASFSIDENFVRQSLATFQVSHLGTDLLSAEAVRDIKIQDDGQVRISLRLGYPLKNYQDTLKEAIKNHFQDLLQSASIADLTKSTDFINVDIQSRIHSHTVQKNVKTLDNIKNIIVVASGKGGVGKSTVACNLALAIQAEGANVGILDADIYGPSQPKMLGGSQEKPETREKKLLPIMRYGLQTMSIGYLVEEENTPMIWRGPMVSSALQQLLFETEWSNLDYLIVDLPPGTGDIQLTMAQKIPLAGAIIVTTPQEIALLDARKAYMMFQKVGVSVIGVIENMTGHVCTACGHADPIFGEEGAVEFQEQFKVPLLGQIPLDRQIREHADNGKPIVYTLPESKIAEMYREIARQTTGRLSLKPRDLRAPFQSVIVK